MHKLVIGGGVLLTLALAATGIAGYFMDKPNSNLWIFAAMVVGLVVLAAETDMKGKINL